ncbi:MAG: uroporphyrinogen-III synthase [Flavobacteriales bacterium]|nr:uroporphyrinogen-III synthase [Flavobacteriales bacterium]
MVKSIFISKTPDEVRVLFDFLLENDQSLIAQSFLSFDNVNFTVSSEFDIVFFNSPRSVQFFLENHKLENDTLIACTGYKTAEIIASFGYSVHFIGNEASKTSQIAREFKEWCNGRKVLFPISNISLKTISSIFAEEEKEELVVYKTKVEAEEIPNCDTYIFTSPSNVRGFLINNTIPNNAKVISWGESTTRELGANGIVVNRVLLNATIEELFEIL